MNSTPNKPKMISCVCGNEVSPFAKTCPSCGAPDWKLREIAKKAYLASLTPEQLEKRKRDEALSKEKRKKSEKKTWLIIGASTLAVLIFWAIANNAYNAKPIHGEATASGALGQMLGWNETVRGYDESDSREVKCGAIKANHKGLVVYSGRHSKSELETWEHRWRQNNCKNGVKYPLY